MGHSEPTRRRRWWRWATAVALVVGGGGLATGTLAPAEKANRAPRVGSEVPASAMNQSLSAANNSPQVVTDPNEAAFVAMANRLDAPDFSCALQLSGDAGRTWAPAAPVRRLPAGADKCYAPEVAFDRRGVLYYLFVGLVGRGNEPMGAFLTTSADRGRSFSAPRRLLGPRNFAVRMAIDPSIGRFGRLHLVWLHARTDPPLGGFGPPPNPILAAHSDDGGRSLSRPVQVGDPARERVVAPSLALGPNGAVHVAYFDLKQDAVDYQGLAGPVHDDTWALVVSTSRNSGGRFRKAVVIDDAIVPAERVMLIFTMPPASLAARGEQVCAAWSDARHGDADAILACSNDSGRRWAGARRLNDDPAGTGHRQSLPKVGIAPGGRIDAVFLDRRSDPRNIVNHVYYTYSNDGGRSFSPNRRLTTKGSDSRHGQRYAVPSAAGMVEFGARLGLVSGRSTLLVAWPDTRHSRPSSTSQDLYVLTVAFPEPDRVGWATPLGAALVAAGVVTLVIATRRPRRRSDTDPSPPHHPEAASPERGPTDHAEAEGPPPQAQPVGADQPATTATP